MNPSIHCASSVLVCSSFFVVLTLSLSFASTVLAVSGIQITIVVMGRFTENRLPEYVQCLEDSLRNSPNIPQNFSIPDNSTFPVSLIVAKP